MGDIFYACKRGNLEHVRELVEEMGCSVNVSDKWNSTPLYYACLAGYEDLVYYLLQSGAKFLDEWSGERCMNGALTDKIRRILQHPPSLRIPYDTFRDSMEFMLTEAYNLFADVCLVIGAGHKIHAHKVVLCQRSTYFENTLQGHNRAKYFMYFKHPKETSLEAWVQVLSYVYTDSMVLDKCLVQYKNCLHLSRRLGIPLLTKILRSTALIEQLHSKSTKPILINSRCAYFEQLAVNALPNQFITEATMLGHEKQPFSDLCVLVDNQRFYCHKAFMASHSAYFRALLNNSQFCEISMSTRGKLTFITLNNIGAHLFSLIIGFIYLNTTEVSKETLHDLLYYSDHYMISGLKDLCGKFLADNLQTDNVVQTLALARMVRMTKLQHACLQYIALHFEKVYQVTEFIRMLRHDERTLRLRRRFRVSESSLDEEEMEEDEEPDYNKEVQCVDMLMDLRLYLRELTNLKQHSIIAQLREEKCVEILENMLLY